MKTSLLILFSLTIASVLARSQNKQAETSRFLSLKNLTEEEGDSLIVKSVPKENFNVPKHPLKAEWKKFDKEHPVKAKPSPKKAKVLMKAQKNSAKKM